MAARSGQLSNAQNRRNGNTIEPSLVFQIYQAVASHRNTWALSLKLFLSPATCCCHDIGSGLCCRSTVLVLGHLTAQMFDGHRFRPSPKAIPSMIWHSLPNLETTRNAGWSYIVTHCRSGCLDSGKPTLAIWDHSLAARNHVGVFNLAILAWWKRIEI